MSFLRNPWGRPRFLPVLMAAYLVWVLVPVAIAVLFSFNDGRSRSSWQGFSTRWYLTDPGSVLQDTALRLSLVQSLRLAALTMVIAVPLGVGLAVGLARWRGRGSQAANTLMLLPLITPEIVTGVALFIVFTTAFDLIPLGVPAQLLGHVTFSVSFVVVVLRARLFAIGRQYEEAAQDLGASPFQALRLVLLPLLSPAIFASLAIVFALSLDDFVISAFLATGQNSTTLPVLLYSSTRVGPTPALNALASCLLFGTLLALGAAAVLLRRERARRGARGGTAEDLTRLRI